MKKLEELKFFAPYITTIARVLAVILVSAGSFFYWKVGFGSNKEDQIIAFIFGTFPIVYGLLIGLISLKSNRERRIQILNTMVGIPIVFAITSLVAALIYSSLK